MGNNKRIDLIRWNRNSEFSVYIIFSQYKNDSPHNNKFNEVFKLDLSGSKRYRILIRNMFHKIVKIDHKYKGRKLRTLANQNTCFAHS